MTERTLQKKVNQYKDFEQQKKTIEKQMEVLQQDIKIEMQNRGSSETVLNDWIVRFKEVASSRFDSKVFKTDHPKLYQKYMTSSLSMRFSITENA